MRERIRRGAAAAGCCLLAWLGARAQAGAADAVAPNVVILYADDLGYGDLGCQGHPSIRTPRLDRLAGQGMRFSDCYSAAEVCTPSRAALLTGRYPVRSGMCHDVRRVLHRDSRGHLPAAEITLAEALRERGYATACVGKWHLGNFTIEPAGHPHRHGFDFFFGLPHSNDMDATPQAPWNAVERRDQDSRWWNLSLWRQGAEIERPADQATLTRRTIDEAISFVAAHEHEPFFLYVPFTFPHVPLFASAEFRGRSRHGIYGDVVEELDAGVGRLLDALAERGLDDRTLVVFSSDNGPWLTMGPQGGSAGPLRDGKGSTWEGGMRVPLIARLPGRIPAGSVHRGVVSTMDLFPTCLALAGAAPPAGVTIDGVDLAPALFADRAVERQAFFYYRGTRLFAVRSGRWKAHLFTQPAYGEPRATPHAPPLLFDLEADVGEEHDVAADHPEVVARLLGLARAQEAACPPAASQLGAARR